MKNLPNKMIFFFQSTNPKIIPSGAKRVERNQETTQKKRETLGVLQGQHTEAKAVTVWLFVKQLFQDGYKISDLHHFVKTDGSNKKYVVAITFSKDGAMIFLEKQTLADLEVLIRKDAWGHFHFWKNHESWCLHCLHRIPDGASATDVGEFMVEPDEPDSEFVYEKI